MKALNLLMRQCTDIFFFFQAEDGIRDYKVTGVQTCALPISHHIFKILPVGAMRHSPNADLKGLPNREENPPPPAPPGTKPPSACGPAPAPPDPKSAV